MGALLELRGQLRNLQWYGEVNRRGFIKILKKLDKKVPNTSTQQRYLANKVDPKQFATNYRLSQDLRAINDWLSTLGDAKVFDDTSSVHSAASFRTVSSRAMLSLPSGLLDTVEQAIRSDDPSVLSEVLLEANASDDPKGAAYQKLLQNLLQRSITCRSKLCIDTLLAQIASLDEEDDLHRRNILHRLVIHISRAKRNEIRGANQSSDISSGNAQFIVPAEMPVNAPPPCETTENEHSNLLSGDDESVQFLKWLLDNLQPAQRIALQAKDNYGRLPLHYAAQYGFVVICQIIIKHMQDWNMFDVSKGIDAPEWQDGEGLAPLHLSVINSHPLTTKALLSAEKWQGATKEQLESRREITKSGVVLALATKANNVSIVELLVEAGVNINYQDEQGECALHVAARFGHTECAKVLIMGSTSEKAEVNLAEKTFAWTPLFVACVDGHLPIVELLIAAGADLERPDSSGWTAKEHAALRGHMPIAEKLAPLTRSIKSPHIEPVSAPALSSSPPNALSLEDRRSNTVAKETPIRAPEPVKTFGHRYLQKESLVLVSLGSMDTRKIVDAVKLEAIPLADAHATQLDTALSIVVSASGASGEPTVIDLPIQENISTDPISFRTFDASKVKLLFDIVPTYAGAHDRIVGRAVALLSSMKPAIGSKRMSLQGDVSVPIVSANTLEVIGVVNFNFLVIHPFAHPDMAITEQHTYWKKMAGVPQIIGHRGLGKNMAGRRSLQLGENTIQSFIAAANLGATYVEFDVQLTKDHVPVIYHDFLVSETGIDAPVHTLTLEQFLHVSQAQTPRPSRPPSPKQIIPTEGGRLAPRRPRAQSVGSFDNKDQLNIDMNDRMKHTRDFKKKGFKGNLRNHSIQESFTTLEEMFRKIPETTGFNIEMKYPMLFESEEQEMDTYAVELNSFVDTVLKMVYDFGKKRNIIFSSFNPDICLLLSFKQPSIPILFLTDAGTSFAGDIRATSLQEAIRFASRWNLLGVVSAAEPLVLCPRLVRAVKESGLVCVSYGTLNNDSVNVQVSQSISGLVTSS